MGLWCGQRAVLARPPWFFIPVFLPPPNRSTRPLTCVCASSRHMTATRRCCAAPPAKSDTKRDKKRHADHHSRRCVLTRRWFVSLPLSLPPPTHPHPMPALGRTRVGHAAPARRAGAAGPPRAAPRGGAGGDSPSSRARLLAAENDLLKTAMKAAEAANAGLEGALQVRAEEGELGERVACARGAFAPERPPFPPLRCTAALRSGWHWIGGRAVGVRGCQIGGARSREGQASRDRARTTRPASPSPLSPTHPPHHPTHQATGVDTAPASKAAAAAVAPPTPSDPLAAWAPLAPEPRGGKADDTPAAIPPPPRPRRHPLPQARRLPVVPRRPLSVPVGRVQAGAGGH